jgi:hypothetical protein
VERRQFKRKSLGDGNQLRVSLFLNSQSLVYEGKTEEFEIEASAFDVSRGGLGIQLQFPADFIGLLPKSRVMVRVHGKDRDMMLPARVAYFESEHGRIGVAFQKQLADLNFIGA